MERLIGATNDNKEEEEKRSLGCAREQRRGERRLEPPKVAIFLLTGQVDLLLSFIFIRKIAIIADFAAAYGHHFVPRAAQSSAADFAP